MKKVLIENIKSGDILTVGNCKPTGDRSFSGSKVVVKKVDAPFVVADIYTMYSKFKGYVLLSSEYDFYLPEEKFFDGVSLAS